ncbi:MAG: hypothetical protein ACLTE4_12270 [Christensenellaceae bacterium]|jgi:hypothetical protein|nr:hypothetical protein [Clostridia bacterium]PWM02450.1 MAG: hypothetical protein DBY05_02160 [Clostridiales bacterium]
MAKKKSISLGAIILTAIALVGAVLTITGLFLNWTKYSVESVLLNKEYQYTLKDLAETNSNLGDNGFKMFGAMNAFAYITMILALVSFASVALAKFLNMKLIKPVAALAGLLTILSTILLIVFVCMFCSKNAGFSFSIAGVNLADGKFGWSVGPILMVIGGFLSGLPALAAYKK